MSKPFGAAMKTTIVWVVYKQGNFFFLLFWNLGSPRVRY